MTVVQRGCARGCGRWQGRGEQVVKGQDWYLILLGLCEMGSGFGFCGFGFKDGNCA